MNRNPLAGLALATTLTLGAAAPAGAALTFTFEYRDVNVGFNDPAQGAIRRQALEETAALLSGLFPGLTANITLEVDGSETRDGTLAAAGSRLRPDCIIGFGDRGIVGVKALGGEDINGATADGTVTVNFEDVIWDFDDTIDIPNAFDFKSTMLHELLHAMGFANSLVEADGRDSCGRRPPSQGGFRPFDDFLGDTSQDVISASGVVDAARWARIRVGGTGSAGTLWRGDNARALNNGDPVPMYSPTSFSQGSSISHVDTDFYTQQEILMEHATTPGPGARTLTGIEVGILRDIGFTSVGTSGGGGGTGNRICANPNAAIPDNNTAGLISPLNVTLAGNISDLNVSINASHTFVGDLTFSLTQVSTGRTVRLINRPGSGGCGGDSIAVTLDDSAAANADDTCSNAPALSGSLRPTEPLSQFNGSELSGEWRLAFADNAAADTGLLSQWCLIPET
ncbi:MAG: proprotein convertase P-domain-containing protein, partial [Pseudomonadota bacterium]